MSDRDKPEAQSHWNAVTHTERVIGCVVALAGVVVNQLGTANGMGWFLTGAGLWMAVPNIRGFFSFVVDKVPGLPSRPK